MFHVVGNVALNDFNLFDLSRLSWVTVALYCQDGFYPLSRWGHKLVSNDNQFLLFGGVNLKSFCEGSTIYEFTIDD